MNVASLDDFVPIIGYEGLYWINGFGVVKTIIRKGTKGEIIKPQLGNRGYYYVGLTKNGKRKNYSIHRLLAMHFIPNTRGHRFVNHLNGVKTDNDLQNLEWCTSSENNMHAYRTGLKIPHRGRTTNKLSDANIERVHEYIRLGLPKWAIAQNMGIHRSTLHRLLTGRSITYARR